MKRTRRQICIDTDYWFEAGLFALFIKLDRAIKIAVVRERQSLHPMLFGHLYQLRNLGQSLEQAVVAVGMQVSEFHSGIIIQIMKFIIGVDEAGRGPIAGPVSVGVFGAEEKIGKWILKNLFQNKLRDSKKLSAKKREEIYQKLLILKREGQVFFAVTHVSNQVIDKLGISKAIQIGIEKCLKNLNVENLLKTRLAVGQVENSKFKIKLDGLLKAPAEYKDQKTIIKGDEKDVFIACASIVAKVSRDRLVCKLAKKHPEYSFEIHKGYGTQAHREAILKIGLSSHHRISYCKNIK